MENTPKFVRVRFPTILLLLFHYFTRYTKKENCRLWNKFRHDVRVCVNCTVIDLSSASLGNVDRRGPPRRIFIRLYWSRVSQPLARREIITGRRVKENINRNTVVTAVCVSNNGGRTTMTNDNTTTQPCDRILPETGRY